MTALRLVLAGASTGNGNRGVEALGRSVLDGIVRHAPGSRVSLLDDGWGVRPETSGRYTDLDLEQVGVRLSRRWHRPESWGRVRLSQTAGTTRNPVAQRLAESDAVLDISGGDSFTDLYGPFRLRTISAPKAAAIRARRPLVLLPQTYGPFTTRAGRARAESLVRSVSLAYARDPASLEILRDLAGPAADTARLRAGVDVASALNPRRPAGPDAESLESLDGEVLAGVNVSGLLSTPQGQARFGLAGDYLATMTSLVHALVDAGAHVVLVPHVHTPGGGENDIAAIEAVVSTLPRSHRDRTTVLRPDLDAAELKWCIARLAWFTGSRMHSTIASLSSGVATCGYAYSDKTAGVFTTAGMDDQVHDARQTAGEAAVARMMESFRARATTRARLGESVEPVVSRARAQLGEILADVRAWRLDPAQRASIT